MKFSERLGIIKAKDTIQVKYIDDDLKNGLWNAIKVFYLDNVDAQYIHNSKYNGFFINLWHNFFKLPLDTMDDWYGTTRKQIRNWYFDWEWYEIYDFIEFISSAESPSQSGRFIDFCNALFEKELSGYRFINGIISPITNELEVKNIDEAITNSTKNSLVGVKTHIENALRMISDRNNFV